MNTKLLIVDDRPENIKTMLAVLEDVTAEIDTAISGNQALGLVLENDYALVLLDVQMPEMDGFEVAEIMRSHHQSKHTPIIFVTAISKEQQYIFKGYQSGAMDYLFKPFDLTVLLSKVKIFIELYENKQTLLQAYKDLEAANQKILQQQEQRLNSERLTLLAEMATARVAELNIPIKTLASYLNSAQQQSTKAGLFTDEFGKAELLLKELSNRVEMLSILDINQISNQKEHSPEIIENIHLKLLLLDHDEQEHHRICQLSSPFSGISIDSVYTVSEALQKIPENHYDLIISESELSDNNVLALIENLRKQGIPTLVVILTKQTSPTFAAEIIKAGAYDYVDKSDLNRDRLSALLIACNSTLLLRNEVQKTREQIKNRSTQDSLTGLLQRDVLNETLPRLLNEANAAGSNLAIGMIDFDYFKQTNDTYGHLAGDYVLKEFAKIMIDNFRTGDLIFRYGGEEFLVVMPKANLPQAKQAGERLRQALADYTFEYEGQTFKKTLSIGIASRIESGKHGMTDLIDSADKKLYQAKQQGRNRVLA